MSRIYTTPLDFHEGERTVQSLLHVPSSENPTSPGLSPHASRLLHLSSLLAVGVVDDQGRPWTTLLGGQTGFVRSLGQSLVGVKTLVDREYDPVVEILVGDHKDSSAHEAGQNGRPMSALGVHLASRDRVKLVGRTVVCAVEDLGQVKEHLHGVPEMQMVFAIQRSLGMYRESWAQTLTED